MVNDMYLIESQRTATPVSLEGFVPQRKVALLIHASGRLHGPSFRMIVDLLVQRGYDYITSLGVAQSVYCSDMESFQRSNLEGKVDTFAKELTPQDVLFTAVLGASATDNGLVYVSDSLNDKVYGHQIRNLFATVPVHHAIHYVSPDMHAGDFAQLFSDAQHPDLGTRHIGIAATVPSVPQSLFPYKKDLHSPELVHPFHAGFLDLADKPTLLDRFRGAALYHRQHVDAARYGTTKAYLRHASVQPQEVACTR